jgi:hypothetical protein
MSCSSCGAGRFSPEYTKKQKPQNHNGCCCSGGNNNSCDTPSSAPVGSPLYNWEQIHGKLITNVTFVQDEFGHKIQVVEKIPCPIKSKPKKSTGCCSLRYRTKS